MNAHRKALLGSLILTDNEGRIIFCSQPFADRAGESTAALLGRRASEFLPEQAWSGAPFTLGGVESELQQFDVAGAGGEVYIHVLIIRDRGAAQPHAEAETLSAHALTEIPRLTHDLNNLFTVIYASLDMSLRLEVGQQERRQALESAQRAAVRGAETVTRIRHAVGRDPIALPASAARKPVALQSSSRQRVLVLTRDNSLGLLLRAVLGYRGLEVHAAGDLAAAEARWNSGVDLLIVDVSTMADDWTAAATRARTLLLCQADAPQRNGYPCLRRDFKSEDLVERVRAVLDAPGPAQE